MITNLTPFQLDAIREVGNIGAGHAATVLSQLLNKRVAMSVPKVNILPLAEACDVVGGPEQPMVGVKFFPFFRKTKPCSSPACSLMIRRNVAIF